MESCTNSRGRTEKMSGCNSCSGLYGAFPLHIYMSTQCMAFPANTRAARFKTAKQLEQDPIALTNAREQRKRRHTQTQHTRTQIDRKPLIWAVTAYRYYDSCCVTLNQYHD